MPSSAQPTWRAGYRVGILERRPVVTEQTFPGYRFDLGGSAHIFVHNTPIVRELELERHGLKCIDIDPLFFAPFPDGSRLFVWEDVERTCRSIAAISPQDAEIYSRFIEDWRPFAQAIVDSFLQAPSPLDLVRTLGIKSGVRRDLRRRLQAILSCYGGLLRKTFVSPQLQAVIGAGWRRSPDRRRPRGWEVRSLCGIPCITNQASGDPSAAPEC